MSLLSRLLGRPKRSSADLRPLWHEVVAIARQPHWYAHGQIADSVPGRFDAITVVLALVLLRLERDAALAEPSTRLAELFVKDMDGQLRESGVGDLVVGKHIGRLMSVLGGRLGAFREALAADDTALAGAVARNVTFTEEGANTAYVATAMRALAARLDGLSDADIMAGRIAE